MRSEGLGGSQDGPEVPGILNLIERQQEGRLAALAGDLEEGVQLEVLARRHARHDALMTVGTGDRRELLARAVGDLDADAARQRDHFRERPAPAREHRDLIDAPSAATEQLEDRVPPPDAVLAHTLFRVMRGPLGVSSTLQPSRSISSRSWSARLQSRRALAIVGERAGEVEEHAERLRRVEVVVHGGLEPRTEPAQLLGHAPRRAAPARLRVGGEPGEALEGAGAVPHTLLGEIHRVAIVGAEHEEPKGVGLVALDELPNGEDVTQ